jgi:hypothetical protein
LLVWFPLRKEMTKMSTAGDEQRAKDIFEELQKAFELKAFTIH